MCVPGERQRRDPCACRPPSHLPPPCTGRPPLPPWVRKRDLLTAQPALGPSTCPSPTWAGAWGPAGGRTELRRPGTHAHTHVHTHVHTPPPAQPSPRWPFLGQAGWWPCTARVALFVEPAGRPPPRPHSAGLCRQPRRVRRSPREQLSPRHRPFPQVRVPFQGLFAALISNGGPRDQ